MFDKSFKRVIGHEGGYTNDPDDKGNWDSGKVGQGSLKGTKFGISAMSYPHLDIENLTLEQAKQIYFQDFWCKKKIDQLPDVMQYQMFDAGINHGYVNANKMLQRALGVNDDGVIGPITLRAANSMDELALALEFNKERLHFYTRIKTFDKYGRGWSRRLADNLSYAVNDL